MLKSALKKNQGPMPTADSWAAPADWDKNALAPTLSTNGSSSSTRSPSFNTVTTDTTNGSKSVGFSSSASFSTADSAGRSTASLALQPREGKQVFRIYRFHTPGMRLTHALLVDEKTEDCVFYIDYGNAPMKGWFCRMFRGQDTSGELVYVASRGSLSTKFELTRFSGDEKHVTIVSNSGLITTKYGFKGYDGQSFAWKSRSGGYELLNYANNKSKSKTSIGTFTSGTQTMKKDSYVTFESPSDPRAADLFLLVAFSIEDHELSSNYANHATPSPNERRAADSSDDDLDHR